MIYTTSGATNHRFERTVSTRRFDEFDSRSPLHLDEADCDALYGVRYRVRDTDWCEHRYDKAVEITANASDCVADVMKSQLVGSPQVVECSSGAFMAFRTALYRALWPPRLRP